MFKHYRQARHFKKYLLNTPLNISPNKPLSLYYIKNNTYTRECFTTYEEMFRNVDITKKYYIIDYTKISTKQELDKYLKEKFSYTWLNISLLSYTTLIFLISLLAINEITLKYLWIISDDARPYFEAVNMIMQNDATRPILALIILINGFFLFLPKGLCA